MCALKKCKQKIRKGVLTMKDLGKFMEKLNRQYGKGFTTKTLAEWLTTNERLTNRHEEYFLVRIDDEIKEISREELNTQIGCIEIIGVSKWGNKYQMVQATVHGVNLNNPEKSSPFERPTTEVAAHCYIGLTAIDEKGQRHIFRPFQVRQGKVYLDCHRGFADKRTDGTKEEQHELVMANVNKILKEEVGHDLVKINSIKFIGKFICETAFAVSTTPCFLIDIDYVTFKKNQQLLTGNEDQDSEQFKHEGSLPRGLIVDMTKKDHEKYLCDSNILKDASCDWIYNRIFAEK